MMHDGMMTRQQENEESTIDGVWGGEGDGEGKKTRDVRQRKARRKGWDI